MDQALASEIKAISATLAVRRVVEVRLIRRGLAAIRPTRSVPSRAGNSHAGWSTRWLGKNSWRAMAAATAMASGRRGSPSVALRQAGSILRGSGPETPNSVPATCSSLRTCSRKAARISVRHGSTPPGSSE